VVTYLRDFCPEPNLLPREKRGKGALPANVFAQNRLRPIAAGARRQADL